MAGQGRVRAVDIVEEQGQSGLWSQTLPSCSLRRHRFVAQRQTTTPVPGG